MDDKVVKNGAGEAQRFFTRLQQTRVVQWAGHTGDLAGRSRPAGAHRRRCRLDAGQLHVTEFDGTGTDSDLLDLGETIDYTHLSADGTVLLFTRERVEGDVWLIE